MNTLEAYVAGVSGKTPDEREVLRRRNEVIAASPSAPGWLQLTAAWTLAALTSLDVAGDPALAATEACMSSDAELAAVEDALQKLDAYGRFAELSKLFASEEIDELAGLLETLPESLIATLKKDLAWLVGDLTAYPDIRALAASLAVMLEAASAGEVDRDLITDACVAASEAEAAQQAWREHPDLD